MRFNEIIGLHEYFQPVFNMENETDSYWKQFIPNEKFYEILNKVLLAVSSTDVKNKLSVWLVGRYGTGKSHASSVIKHLLWDDLDSISDYLDSNISRIEIKEKIRAFRREKRIFPVILKGGGNIIDARTLSLEIERAVKKSLRQNDIEITTKSDFDKIIDKINDNFLNWDSIINENPDLEMYVSNKDEIISKLEQENIEFLRIVERILSEKSIHFSHERISIWLKELSDELVKKGIASGLMIFWDEFTTVLEKETISEIIDEIQSIAELSPQNNIYLYLISHRDYNQFGRNVQDTLDKVKDRFHNLKYPMVPITTYQILSAALKKKNFEIWEELKNEVFNNTQLNDIVTYITHNDDGVRVEDSIKNLYPLQPYAVYLSTFLARNIGSTQRSIFNFIYDSEFGFVKFLNEEIDEKKLLTADLLWDFYAEELERDKENRFMQVLEKYNAYKRQIEDFNHVYLKVFKGVLLLNTLYRITDYSNPETDKVRPHVDNIKKLFIGTNIENYVDGALEYINDREIIQKNPNDLFEISNTSLPRQEVDSEKESLKNQYNNIVKILDFNGKNKIESIFNEDNGVLRRTRVKIFSTDTNIHILKSNLNKHFQPSYFLDFAVFLKLNNDENDTIENLINQIKRENEFKHIIFINIQEPLGENKYKNFIEYLARANVLRNHSYNDESAKEEEFAKKIINGWIESINYLDIYAYFFNNKVVNDIKNIGKYINDYIAPKIFNKGIDIIKINIATVWQFQSAKKAIEYVLNCNNRTDLETQPKAQYGYIKDIFKDKDSDYVIDKNLKIKDSSISHPVIEIYLQVKNIIEKASKKPSFNLAEELRFLSQPPYGLYTNILNMAVLGYAFRSFVDKLYVANEGVLINTTRMRDKVNEIFECWQKGRGCDKLNVRLGSEEEKELIKELADLFDIKKYTGLQDVRWKIKDVVRNIGFPIWSLKYGDIQYEHHKDIIEDINRIVFELTDTEIDIVFVKKLLPNIQKNRFDLRQIFNTDNYKIGFTQFIISKGDGKIKDDELENVIAFIKQNQPEELNWKENDVENSILKYIIERDSAKKTPTPPQLEPAIPPQPEPATQETIKMVKEKIEKFEDINDLKNWILQILKENSFIAEVLNKYL